MEILNSGNFEFEIEDIEEFKEKIKDKTLSEIDFSAYIFQVFFKFNF